jgi:hypothetical protein
MTKELGGITKQTLYCYVSPNGKLREYGKKVLSDQESQAAYLDDICKQHQ